MHQKMDPEVRRLAEYVRIDLNDPRAVELLTQETLTKADVAELLWITEEAIGGALNPPKGRAPTLIPDYVISANINSYYRFFPLTVLKWQAQKKTFRYVDENKARKQAAQGLPNEPPLPPKVTPANSYKPTTRADQDKRDRKKLEVPPAAPVTPANGDTPLARAETLEQKRARLVAEGTLKIPPPPKYD